jgi:hypothetical protein
MGMCRSARLRRELARAVMTDATVPGRRPAARGAAGDEPAFPLSWQVATQPPAVDDLATFRWGYVVPDRLGSRV